MSISVNISAMTSGGYTVTGHAPGAAQPDTQPLPELRARQPEASVPAPLQTQERGVQFQVDEATGMTIVRVVNKATGEVVRQIPNEVVIRIAQYLRSECGDAGGFDLTA